MVFKNIVLRETNGAQGGGGEERQNWRKLSGDEFHNLYSLLIIRVIKSRCVRWVGHVACNEGRELHTCFWWGKSMERDHLENLGEDGRIVSIGS